MSTPNESSHGETHESTYEQYVLDVRIVEVSSPKADAPRYRFEAPDHQGQEFTDPELATLYADVYFCTNGFVEEGTGERGIPPEVIGAGRAVLAAYFLTLPGTDRDWVASFFGKKPHRIRKYVEWVRGQADEVRTGVKEQDVT
jgi:hypothetical protein